MGRWERPALGLVLGGLEVVHGLYNIYESIYGDSFLGYAHDETVYLGERIIVNSAERVQRAFGFAELALAVTTIAWGCRVFDPPPKRRR